ncbi:hypothetical protein N7493_003136 [Penicillium malachiteum]|uniref:Uncharacterized protein n=1 Tax=Penicillium malachiteum TaxID=1324776 RepID=A0AAD6MZQ9_9EURO|nr:hypothetical protein N7493_003136 [Penicillium malachiteum]
MAHGTQTLGWIWPKDPRPGNPTSWPRRWRLRDILTNKGPDIYVGVINKKRPPERRPPAPKDESSNDYTPWPWFSTPSSYSSSDSEPDIKSSPRLQKTNWDRWNNAESPNSSTISSESSKQPEYQVPWARRGSEERYDFRQRKYTIPDLGTWSRVEYCATRGKGGWMRIGSKGEKHCVPRRYWDRNGTEYPANYWHDIIHGEHEDEVRK